MHTIDARFMRLALRLARRGFGLTSPNPMVGAVVVKGGKIIGRGWHRRAGEAHAEIEALRDVQRRGLSAKDATLYVTLEPCCTHGRTPPCTDAIKAARIKRVVAGTTDPNPMHRGKALAILRRAGVEVNCLETAAQSRSSALQALGRECAQLNESFNHWIVRRTPFVTVKAAMTLDGKIATAEGESKWITGKPARAFGMKLRQAADAILVGVNTILADDPELTLRKVRSLKSEVRSGKVVRRIVLDSLARTPVTAKVVTDAHAALTTIVVSRLAPKSRIKALATRVNVVVAPLAQSKINSDESRAGNQKSKIHLGWLLKWLGRQNITHLLVEGGGEVNASFLLGRFAQGIAFFYAPKILGGRDARKAVAGDGARSLKEAINLYDLEWQRVGEDLLLTARCARGKRAE